MLKMLFIGSNHIAMWTVDIPVEIKQTNRHTIQQMADNQGSVLAGFMRNKKRVGSIAFVGFSLLKPVLEHIYNKGGGLGLLSQLRTFLQKKLSIHRLRPFHSMQLLRGKGVGIAGEIRLP